MIFGIVVIIVGVALLLQNLGIVSGDLWSVLWPLLVILLGAGIVARRHGGHGWWCWHCRKEDCDKCRMGHHHHHAGMEDEEKPDRMH